jgi:hypothetical protein
MHPRSSWTCPSTYLPLFFTSFTFFKAPNHYLFVHLFLLPFFFFFFFTLKNAFLLYFSLNPFSSACSRLFCSVPHSLLCSLFFFFFPAFTKIHQLYSESKLLMLSDVLMNCFFFLYYFNLLQKITREATQMGSNPQNYMRSSPDGKQPPETHLKN